MELRNLRDPLSVNLSSTRGFSVNHFGRLVYLRLEQMGIGNSLPPALPKITAQYLMSSLLSSRMEMFLVVLGVLRLYLVFLMKTTNTWCGRLLRWQPRPRRSPPAMQRDCLVGLPRQRWVSRRGKGVKVHRSAQALSSMMSTTRQALKPMPTRPVVDMMHQTGAK